MADTHTLVILVTCNIVCVHFIDNSSGPVREAKWIYLFFWLIYPHIFCVFLLLLLRVLLTSSPSSLYHQTWNTMIWAVIPVTITYVFSHSKLRKLLSWCASRSNECCRCGCVGNGTTIKQTNMRFGIISLWLRVCSVKQTNKTHLPPGLGPTHFILHRCSVFSVH